MRFLQNKYCIKNSTTKLTDIMMLRKFILFFFLWFQFGTLCAQVTVKTNLLGWGTASINGGIETKVSAKSTISLFGSINPFEFGNHKQWKHWLLQPEYRYWFCIASSVHCTLPFFSRHGRLSVSRMDGRRRHQFRIPMAAEQALESGSLSGRWLPLREV